VLQKRSPKAKQARPAMDGHKNHNSPTGARNQEQERNQERNQEQDPEALAM